MIKAIKFRNFKCLKDFSIRLRDMNVFVGPNNAGKSTVLDAFRALGAGLAVAARRNPAMITVADETVQGYEIPETQIPISLANIHSDYRTDLETSITYSFENGNKLRMIFHDNSRCVLAIEQSSTIIRNTGQFRQAFPLTISSFPTLGPLEDEEDLLTDEYVRQWQNSRRAHRMFRNIWYRRKDSFAAFQALVEATWPGMSISPPERRGYNPPHLTMFCKEGRVDRELCWAGFGFQVWLQLLTHLTNASSADLLIVDEPEIYLHPDLQHKLFQLLRGLGKQVILATHSAEIINDADHDDIVLVNRSRRSGRRISDLDGLQEALMSIGSDQNIHLARLSRGRKILFLEGNDHRILSRLAAKYGFSAFANDLNVTIIPIGGFSQRQRIEDAAWTFEKVLKTEVAIAAVLDRDFRCNEEIAEIESGVKATIPHFHILVGKEIENYLLVPGAIARAVEERIKERAVNTGERGQVSVQWISETLLSLCDEIKSEVLSQHIAHRMRYFANRTSKDASTVAQEAIALLDNDWRTPKSRLLVAPGKRLLSALNLHLQQILRISITPAQIIRNLETSDFDAGLHAILRDLESFANHSRQAAAA
jgi:hypothetical protein